MSHCQPIQPEWTIYLQWTFISRHCSLGYIYDFKIFQSSQREIEILQKPTLAFQWKNELYVTPGINTNSASTCFYFFWPHSIETGIRSLYVQLLLTWTLNYFSIHDIVVTLQRHVASTLYMLFIIFLLYHNLWFSTPFLFSAVYLLPP